MSAISVRFLNVHVVLLLLQQNPKSKKPAQNMASKSPKNSTDSTNDDDPSTPPQDERVLGVISSYSFTPQSAQKQADYDEINGNDTLDKGKNIVTLELLGGRYFVLVQM